MIGIKATSASLITITRDSASELQQAVRNMFDRLNEFIVADIEYTVDSTASGSSKYSAIILGCLEDGYIDVDDNQPDTPSEPSGPDNPNPQPDTPSSDKVIEELQRKQEETNQTIAEMQQTLERILSLLNAQQG